MRVSSQITPKSAKFSVMSTNNGSYEVRTEARGPHWIGWVLRPGSDQPDRSVILVGKTREEAEARTRAWAEQSSY